MLMERQRVSIKCNKYWVNQAIQTGEGGLTYLWIELNVDKWEMICVNGNLPGSEVAPPDVGIVIAEVHLHHLIPADTKTSLYFVWMLVFHHFKHATQKQVLDNGHCEHHSERNVLMDRDSSRSPSFVVVVVVRKYVNPNMRCFD